MITPNHLTCLRAFLGAACGFILMSADSAWMYALYFSLFTTAAFTDLWDGQLARKMNVESNFGRIADPIADKILNLTSFFVLSFRDVFSIWWVAAIAIREIAVTVVRIQKINQGKILSAEFAGKLKTTIQYVTIGIAFFVLVLPNWIAEGYFLQGLRAFLFLCLISTVSLTLCSGAIFLAKNCCVKN